MDTETPSEPESESNSAFDFATSVLTKSEEVTSSRRLLTAGAMLGTCFVFLSSMLGLPHLDTPLTIALYAFAVAIPCLIFDFIICTYSFHEYARAIEQSTALALQLTAWAIAEFVGGAAVLIGVVFVLIHLSGGALIAGIAAAVFLGVAFMALHIAFMIHYARVANKTKPTPVAAPSTDTPPA